MCSGLLRRGAGGWGLESEGWRAGAVGRGLQGWGLQGWGLEGRGWRAGAGEEPAALRRAVGGTRRGSDSDKLDAGDGASLMITMVKGRRGRCREWRRAPSEREADGERCVDVSDPSSQIRRIGEYTAKQSVSSHN